MSYRPGSPVWVKVAVPNPPEVAIVTATVEPAMGIVGSVTVGTSWPAPAPDFVTGEKR